MVHGLLTAARLIDDNAVDGGVIFRVRQPAVDAHDGGQATDDVEQDVFIQARAAQDQAIDALFFQGLEHGQLAVRVFIGVAQEDAVAFLEGNLFHAARDF